MAQNTNANRTSKRPHRPRQLHAVPDTAPKPAKPSSPGKQALLAALGSHPQGHGTAVELAHQAQIGQSTARRLLGELTDRPVRSSRARRCSWWSAPAGQWPRWRGS